MSVGAHRINGEFQSDKYPTCPAGKVPLSTKDPTAQPLLWQYAQLRRSVDAEFADDLETALRADGYAPLAVMKHPVIATSPSPTRLELQDVLGLTAHGAIKHMLVDADGNGVSLNTITRSLERAADVIEKVESNLYVIAEREPPRRTSRTHVFAMTWAFEDGELAPPDGDHEWELVSTAADPGRSDAAGRERSTSALWVVWARRREATEGTDRRTTRPRKTAAGTTRATATRPGSSPRAVDASTSTPQIPSRSSSTTSPTRSRTSVGSVATRPHSTRSQSTRSS